MPVLGSIDFKARSKAAWISLFTSFVVLSLKIVAYQQTHSTAVLSDALESVVNVLTAMIALFVINYSAQPADDDHPYGHGKAEFFSAAFEGGLIFFAALMIIVESVRSFLTVNPIKEIEMGVLYVSIATGFNFAVGFYLRHIGTKQKSETLLASASHLLSDVKTTAAVVIGLFVVKLTGWHYLDGILALGVGLHLGYEGLKIASRSFSGLIDGVDRKSIEMLSSLIGEYRTNGIIDIHNLRIIRSGSFHHIDAHLVVPEYWDVRRAHELTHEFEQQVVEKYPYDGEFAFHLDPCQRSFCKKCDIQDCPIRADTFEKVYSFSVADMIQGPQKTNSPCE